MILRRVIQHVKEQNWLAVGIDFVIVVVGVFIGIQVTNWNESLSDQQRAKNYRERLIKDMEVTQQTLGSRQGSYLAQIEYGLAAIDASSEPIGRDEAWAILRSFFQANHAFTITMQRGTYYEMISSEDLIKLAIVLQAEE